MPQSRGHRFVTLLSPSSPSHVSLICVLLFVCILQLLTLGHRNHERSILQYRILYRIQYHPTLHLTRTAVICPVFTKSWQGRQHIVRTSLNTHGRTTKDVKSSLQLTVCLYIPMQLYRHLLYTCECGYQCGIWIPMAEKKGPISGESRTKCIETYQDEK